MLRLWLAMGVGVALLVASGVVASMATAQPSGDPSAVITAFETARNRGDVDTALSYFSDNAVVSQRNVTFSGMDEIRRFVTTASNRSRYVVVTDRHVNGNVVSWTEQTSTQLSGTSGQAPGPTGGNVTSQGQTGFGAVRGGGGTPRGPNVGFTPQTTFSVNVEAVVQDGKILSLAYVFGSQAPRVDPSVDGRAELPASVGLVAVLGVLLSVLMVASTGLRRASPVASSLQGRLMQDLRGWASARE
jgi:ketosteroid isomerase-like protein